MQIRDRKSEALSLYFVHVISKEKLRYLNSMAVTNFFPVTGKLVNSSNVGPIFSVVCFFSTSLLKYTIVSIKRVILKLTLLHMTWETYFYLLKNSYSGTCFVRPLSSFLYL